MIGLDKLPESAKINFSKFIDYSDEDIKAWNKLELYPIIHNVLMNNGGVQKDLKIDITL